MQHLNESVAANAQNVRRLIEQLAPPDIIITAATTPPGDDDYQRRLRLWAADCAARAVHLITDEPKAYDDAVIAISAARLFARHFVHDGVLARFHCPPGSKLYREAERSAASEARLAATLCAQPDVWRGALGAVTHALRAIIVDSCEVFGLNAARSEVDWQIARLLCWLSVPEPTDCPVD